MSHQQSSQTSHLGTANPTELEDYPIEVLETALQILLEKHSSNADSG